MVLKRDKNVLLSHEPLCLTSYAMAFTGEPLSGTTSSWNVTLNPAGYSPPNLGAYTFGASSLVIRQDVADKYTWEGPKNYSGRFFSINSFITMFFNFSL